MKTYSRFLILMLLMWSSFASAAFDYNCRGKDETVPPEPRTYTSDGNTYDTDAFKAWKDANGANKQNWTCCNKLVLNASTRVCEDPSMTDSSLKECTGHGECSDGKGCYQRSDDDLFNPDGGSEADEAAMAEKEQKFEEQQNSLGENGGDKGTGDACYRNMECESYSCKKFKCEAPPKICKLADLGDSAPGNIKCEEPLQKSQTTNICGADVEYYSGLLGDIVVGQKPISSAVGATSAGLRCEYQLYPTGKDPEGKPLGPEKIEGAINLGIRTIRSMEWLYSTASNDDHKDCLFDRFYMKSKMTELIDERKEILKAYNEDMLFVEDNFRTINAAQLEDKTQVSTLCANAGGGFELTTNHDIASRKATGLDFLCYMKARNILYKEYENLMLAWAAKLHTYTTSYRDTAFNRGEKDKNWTTGDKSYEWKDRDCRDWPSWHKKVKRRWSEKYKVKGKDGVNSSVVDVPGVTQYLTFLSDSNAPASFKSRSYYLIDPIMPGGWHQGVGFKDFGASRNLNGKHDRTLGGGLGGTFNSLMAGSVGAALLGPVGFGIAIGMGGGNGSGLANIYDKWDARLVDFVKNLRKDLKPDSFIYEPEIRGSYEMRGCIDKINAPECFKFRQYMSDLKNFSFAQMLAYSRHYKTKYKKYFKEEGTWRRKLFNRYDTDLVNLQKYYTALAGPNGLRELQDKCLDKLIKGVNQDFGTTEGIGVTTGLSNYYNQTSSNYIGADGRDKNYNTKKIKAHHAAGGSFKLSALNFAFKGGGANKDSMSGSTGAGSGAAGGVVGAGALATRVKAMEAANAKAAASGVDLNAKSKELEENMAKASLYSGGAGSMAGRGGSSAGSASGSGSGSSHKATLDAEVDEKSADKNAGNGKGGVASGAAAGANAGAFSGIAAGVASGSGDSSGAGSDSGAGAGDASGMSDEEKDRMSANYDRTKGEYKPNEDDTLFQVLSKTYVRNLDKILTRKKKLEEDAAAAPAQP